MCLFRLSSHLSLSLSPAAIPVSLSLSLSLASFNWNSRPAWFVDCEDPVLGRRKKVLFLQIKWKREPKSCVSRSPSLLPVEEANKCPLLLVVSASPSLPFISPLILTQEELALTSTSSLIPLGFLPFLFERLPSPLLLSSSSHHRLLLPAHHHHHTPLHLCVSSFFVVHILVHLILVCLVCQDDGRNGISLSLCKENQDWGGKVVVVIIIMIGSERVRYSSWNMLHPFLFWPGSKLHGWIWIWRSWGQIPGK